MDDRGLDDGSTTPLGGFGAALGGAPGLEPPFRDRPDLRRPRSAWSILVPLLVVVVGGLALALALATS